MLLTISNLFPRPDQPCRGLFNARLFAALNELTGVRNVCLVPCANLLRWRAIRQWKDPLGAPFHTTYLPVVHVPFLGRNRSWRRYLSALRRVPKPAGVTAVFAAWLYPDGVAALALAQEWNVPGWVLVQGSDTFHLDHPARRRAILDACAKAAGIICVWNGLKDRLVEAGVDPAKIHVVPNGVDTGLFRPRPREEAWGAVRQGEGCQTVGCRPEERDRRRWKVEGEGVSRRDPAVAQGAVADKAADAKGEGETTTEVTETLKQSRARFRAGTEETGEECCVSSAREHTREIRATAARGGVAAALRAMADRVERLRVSVSPWFNLLGSSTQLAPCPRIVLFVGNLVHVKGPDVLIDAWARMGGREGCQAVGCRAVGCREEVRRGKAPGAKNQERRTRNEEPFPNSATQQLNNPTTEQHVFRSDSPFLVFIGDGPMRKGLERQAERLGIQESVVFLGSRPPGEVALWMNVAECLCLPSRSEGCPNVVLEAMASGLPVVASDVGACRELIEHTAACSLVPAGDPRMLSAALQHSLGGKVNRADAISAASLHPWTQQAGQMLCLMRTSTGCSDRVGGRGLPIRCTEDDGSPRRGVV